MYTYGSIVYIEILCLSMAVALPIFLSIHLKYVLFNLTTNEDIRREGLSSSIERQIADLRKEVLKQNTKEKKNELSEKIRVKQAELKKVKTNSFYKGICHSIREIMF